MSQTWQYPIRQIWTHKDPDGDDLEAIRLLLVHGQNRYPGILQAEIIASADRASSLSAVDLENNGILLVGIGGGKYDEHAFGDHPRLAGESAATLVAKDLGIFERPELDANLSYAFQLNHHAISKEFDIALLAKLAFRYLTHTGDKEADDEQTRLIFRDMFMFLNSAEDNEKSRLSGKTPEVTGTRSMDEFVAIWLLETYRTEFLDQVNELIRLAHEKGKSAARFVATTLGVGDLPELRQILEYARVNQKPASVDKTDFELATMVELVQRHSGNTKGMRHKLISAVSTLLTAMLKKNENFFVACKKDFESTTTKHLGEFGDVKVVSVMSDNPEIAKYSRSKHGGYYSVIIKRETSGNTQIFFDQQKNIEVVQIMTAIRLAERRKAGCREHISIVRLEAQGNNVPGAEMWYYDGHQIMNGSLTTSMLPTRLAREEVEEVVMKKLTMMLRTRK